MIPLYNCTQAALPEYLPEVLSVPFLPPCNKVVENTKNFDPNTLCQRDYWAGQEGEVHRSLGLSHGHRVDVSGFIGGLIGIIGVVTKEAAVKEYHEIHFEHNLQDKESARYPVDSIKIHQVSEIKLLESLDRLQQIVDHWS